MNKEFINKINDILNQIEIDRRIKPLIKLYFLGKLRSGELTVEQLGTQIDTLCSRIANVEFSSNNIVAAYEDKSNVLTVNKSLLSEGRADEVILPVFMKFESVLNKNDRRKCSNYIEDFINAGRVAKACSVPISDRLYRLYEIAEYGYGDIENKVDELMQDRGWYFTCSDFNVDLNKSIITGTGDGKDFDKLRNLRPKSIDTDNQHQEESYMGNSKIATILAETIQDYPTELTKDFIVSKVQAVIDRKPGWDSRIKHLVVPFFIRSQQIYNWNRDEFQERLNQLDLNIDNISFEDMGSIDIGGDAGPGAIRLNSRMFFDRHRKIILACC